MQGEGPAVSGRHVATVGFKSDPIAGWGRLTRGSHRRGRGRGWRGRKGVGWGRDREGMTHSEIPGCLLPPDSRAVLPPATRGVL